MTKAERIAFVKAGLAGYAALNERSKERTSKAAWIAFKLGCSAAKASRYVAEAEAEPRLAECTTCLGNKRIRDAETGDLRRCLDCGGAGVR
jgi:hypothetical protein